MNIIEAIKTGRRFKIKDPHGDYEDKWWDPAKDFQCFHVKDVIRDEWEIEPEPEQTIIITKNQISDAFRDVFQMNIGEERFWKALGFK